MLSKSNKIQKTEEIKKIIRTGRTRICDCCRIKYLASEGAKGKTAIIARAVEFRKAVQRNRAKRRFSEVFRLNKKFNEGINIVCFPVKASEGKNMKELVKSIESCLHL
jgi:ribonuclease P protein component